MKIFLAILSCYLLGSIPFGYITGKIFKKIDIREYGSGNIGATNVSRILGLKLASLVAIGDVGKGILAIYLVRFLDIDNLIVLVIAGLAVICGHNWSLFLKFTGGKGIATTFGVFFMLNPVIPLYAIIVWIFIVILTRYVSLASISSVTAILLLMILFKQPPEYIIFSAIIFVFAVIRHKENIKRLKLGKERKFGEKIEIKTDKK